MSWIEPTSRPVACSDLMAVSRPEPGPLTKTSTLRMPCSIARRAAASAASCAANGVDLREPLKPTWPAEAQEITAPVGSVIDTMVLLKVLLMCACPWATFLRSLRRTFLTAVAPARAFGGILYALLDWFFYRCDYYFLPGFFLPATVRFGPLRVRALVRVR